MSLGLTPLRYRATGIPETTRNFSKFQLIAKPSVFFTKYLYNGCISPTAWLGEGKIPLTGPALWDLKQGKGVIHPGIKESSRPSPRRQ